MSFATRVLLIVLLQTALLGAMIAKRQWTLHSGTPIVLETQPVDPRSLFRGDYVTFNYTISRLNLDQLGGEEEFRRKETVYVVLAPGEPYWQPLSAHRTFPALANGQVALKGEVIYAMESAWNPQTSTSEPCKCLQVRYGIEDYFVPEGEGRKLERPVQGEVVTLRITVDRHGSGAISALLINGVERYRETLL